MASDPETLALFRRFMEQRAAQPPLDMSLTPSDLPVPFLPSTDEDKPFGSQEYFNANLTAEKKVGDLLSDPAFISRLGPGTGGARPEDFQPKITYQPVRAPGFQRLAMYAGSNDPVQIIMADVFQNKGTAKEAETAVLMAMENPDHPFYDQLNSDPAIHYVDNQTQTQKVDREYIRKLAGSIEKDVVSDPQFYALDPTTNLPANPVDENGNVITSPQGGGQAFDTSGAGFTDGEIVTGGSEGGEYVQGQDGNWYLRQETPTAMMEYFDEMGLHNPYETYDPDLLADPRDLQHRDEAYMRYQLAQDDYDKAITDNPMDADRFRREAMAKLFAGDVVDKLRLGAIANPSTDQGPDSASPGGMVRRGRGNAPSREEGASREPAPSVNMGGGVMRRGRGSNPSTTDPRMYVENARGRTDQMRLDERNKLADREVQARMSAASMARYLADQERKRNQSGAYWANSGNRKRELQSQRLHAQGYAPYFDQMRAREANIYGF